MMDRILLPQNRIFPLFIVILSLVLYTVAFVLYDSSASEGIVSLSLVPVIFGSWYFGVRGGVLTAVVTVLVSILLRHLPDQSYTQALGNPNLIIGSASLLFTAFIVGRLATVTRERREAIHKLESYEKERRAHTNFLELLNGITGKALEADSLETTLGILVEEIGRLFEADDCFFSYWDEARGVPVPTTAYGSMSDIFPYMNFEPGDVTLSMSVIQAGHPIAVTDMEDSPYIEPKVAMVFPSRSMLGLPLIVQDRKVGSLLLGYNNRRTFDHDDMVHAEMTAKQVALVLSKSQLLEEERKQVRQLTALHEVARVATHVDNEDALIESVTDIIGRNLFPDNFGILLLDEGGEFLHPHPSYRFFSANEIVADQVRLGEGVTGQVALTRQPQLIGNVRRLKHYLDVDERTISELCVPILFKDQLLGAINAESTKRDAFNADDERLLVTLAGQLATAIEQIRRAQAERKWLDQLAHSNELTYSLAHVTTHIEKALDRDEIVRILELELQKIGLLCATAFYDADRALFTFHSTSMDSVSLAGFEQFIGVQFVNFSFSLETLKKRLNIDRVDQPVVVEDPLNEMQIFSSEKREESLPELLERIGINPAAELLRLPLLFEENLLGILWVWGEGVFGTDLPVMSIFAKQIGISLERARLFKEVQELALTDPLTGLSNRRGLFELGRIELARAHRMNRPFCCMILDLDRFKQINDNYGHQTGDIVLREFAERCKGSVREVDLIGRYGGEELIIFLPETDLKTALMVAERLRKSIAENPVKIADRKLRLTVSIGVAQKDEHTLELETLLARRSGNVHCKTQGAEPRGDQPLSSA
jgi:diguanylate cyclase (GGDEF)-like protein